MTTDAQDAAPGLMQDRADIQGAGDAVDAVDAVDTLDTGYQGDGRSAPKVNLLELSCAELGDYLKARGMKSYCREQLLRWVYQFGVSDFDGMTNLSRKARELLKSEAVIDAPEVVAERVSRDGTVKWALRCRDGEIIESVFIPESERGTLCVSTQAGCAAGCVFCRTGLTGLRRNLTQGEILGQVWRACERVGFSRNQEFKPVSNVVLMGMGEPLMNLKAVEPAVEILLSDYAFALSKRRVTISTVGIVPVMEKLCGRLDVALALSLHASDDELRSRLVPLNRRYGLSEVLKAARRYVAAANANCGRVTIEYVLLKGINDAPSQAVQLSELLHDLPCKINLIPFNPHPGSPFRRPDAVSVERFRDILLKRGHTVMRRQVRGDDIEAACGQLAGCLPRADEADAARGVPVARL